jgi:hypothetical protein
MLTSVAVRAQDASQTNQSTRLPETTVLATNELRDNMLIGDNKQPIWTARRPFATTRVYVLPPWQIEAEISENAQVPRDGSTDHFITEEFELGLPHRFQVDFENGDHTVDGDWNHEFNSFEVRYALADWDVIWGNPTLRAEYRINNDEADAYELSLQFGGDLGERIHWGSDLFFEQQIGDDREREYAATLAATYNLIDQKFSAGFEGKFSSESDQDSHSNPENTFEIGPTFQWRPCQRVHLDVAPLFGVTGHSLRMDLFVFLGFDFGRGSRENDAVSPASLRAR